MSESAALQLCAAKLEKFGFNQADSFRIVFISSYIQPNILCLLNIFIVAIISRIIYLIYHSRYMSISPRCRVRQALTAVRHAMGKPMYYSSLNFDI